MKKIDFFPSRLDFVIQRLMDFENVSTAYPRMARSAVPKLFWALSRSEFGENASHNDSSLKHILKKIMIVSVILAVSYSARF